MIRTQYCLLVLLFTACGSLDQSPVPNQQIVHKNKVNGILVKGGLNEYELIEIGPYTCVGMDGYKSGSVWCERTLGKK